MTPEGIRYRRHENAITIAEAVRHLQAVVTTHGMAYARDVYSLDQWDEDGLQAGQMRIERALEILERANTLDEQARKVGQ